MNVFPNTPVYVVSFWPGCSGTFLGVLIAMMLEIKNEAKISKHGNIHNNSGMYRNSKYISYNEEYFKDYKFDYPPSYLVTEPVNPNKPLIIREHQNHNNILFEKYPLAKNIIIQYDIEEREIVEANSFYKIFIDDWKSSPDTQHQWKFIKDKHFNGLASPLDASEELILNYIKEMAQGIPPKPFGLGDWVDNDPRVITISLKDLYTDYRKTLNMLSAMTNKPITHKVIRMYVDYIKGQKILWNLVNYNTKKQ